MSGTESQKLTHRSSTVWLETVRNNIAKGTSFYMHLSTCEFVNPGIGVFIRN